MKTILFLIVATSLTACQSSGDSQGRWNDMWTDIALRHKYEKYACGHERLEGYSKDPICRPVPHIRVSSGPKQEEQRVSAPRIQTVQQSDEQVRELQGKISALEAALQSNVAATNANQSLIVDQIKSLRAQLDAQQTKPAPVAAPLASGIHIP